MSINLSLSFPLGALVRLSAAFTNDELDPPEVDPDTITCKVKKPAGSPEVTTYVYGTDVELVRTAQGSYHVDVIVDVAGTWFYRFEGTGQGQSAAESSFKVLDSEFA